MVCVAVMLVSELVSVVELVVADVELWVALPVVEVSEEVIVVDIVVAEVELSLPVVVAL